MCCALNLLEYLDTLALHARLARHDVERRSHKAHLDRVVVDLLGGLEGRLNRVYALVAEAGDLDIGTYFDGLGREAVCDVLGELLWGDDSSSPSLLVVVAAAAAIPDSIRIGDGQTERIEGMAELLLQRPPDLAVELLEGGARLLGDVAQDGVHAARLVVALLAAEHVLGRDAPLRQVDVALVPVDAQHDGDLVAPHADQLLHGPDPPPRELAQQDHPVRVVVLQQLHVRPHLRDLLHVHHHQLLYLGVLRFVEAAVR